MTTFPYQYAPLPSTHTALPGIDEPLTTTTTQTSEPNPSADITSNVSNSKIEKFSKTFNTQEKIEKISKTFNTQEKFPL